jgi:hypothetical protein
VKPKTLPDYLVAGELKEHFKAFRIQLTANIAFFDYEPPVKISKNSSYQRVLVRPVIVVLLLIY